MSRLLAAALLALLALLPRPAGATVIFITSEMPSGGFESLSIHETFEAISPKDTSLASFASAGITYAPVTGNVFVSSPGYANYGIPGATTSSILTSNGNEYFTVTPGFTVRSLGFDIYTISEPGNPNSVAGADDVVVSVLTAGGTTVLNLPAPMGNFGFLGVISDDPILSLTWQADLGGVRNTGIDNLRVAEAPIPEPGTLLLIGSGLVGLAARRRRR
jgi:hypothetical protein